VIIIVVLVMVVLVITVSRSKSQSSERRGDEKQSHGADGPRLSPSVALVGPGLVLYAMPVGLDPQDNTHNMPTAAKRAWN
jgi:hypothetical protein